MLSDSLDQDYIVQHEFAFSFHLKMLMSSVEQFELAFDRLKEIDIDFNDPRSRDLVWENLHFAASALWQVAQTLDPNIQTKKIFESTTEENRIRKKQIDGFKKKRGEQLLELLDMEIGDKSVLSDFRNGMIHLDERFDEWYMDAREQCDENLSLSWRTLADGQRPIPQPNKAIIYWYDYSWGIFHSLGKRYNLQALGEGVRFVKKKLIKADKTLSEICPRRKSLFL